MGLGYALVHLRFTIPPALLLALLAWPILSRRDTFKTLSLIVVAFVSTTPWDSFIIRRGVWTYPPEVVLGLTFFDIPIEEGFFFIVQTYITATMYNLLAKPVHHPTLIAKQNFTPSFVGVLAIWFGTLAYGIKLVQQASLGTYMGFLLVWAMPFLVLLWVVGGRHLLSMPTYTWAVPIGLPTAWLWLVDTIELRRGTWIIVPGTKLNIQLWTGLEIEEAVFFFLTNCLVTFGMIAFDYALALISLRQSSSPIYCSPSVYPPLLEGSLALLTPLPPDAKLRASAMQDASILLFRKSRSFSLASSVFEGGLRDDLVVLYAFCRVADDLIDDPASLSVGTSSKASSNGHAAKSTTTLDGESGVALLEDFVNLLYGDASPVRPVDLRGDVNHECEKLIAENVRRFLDRRLGPPSQQTERVRRIRAAFELLPSLSTRLPVKPFHDLIAGFKTDLRFGASPSPRADGNGVAHIKGNGDATAPRPPSSFPIETTSDLLTYCDHVAGTLGDAIVRLVWAHSSGNVQNLLTTECFSAPEIKINDRPVKDRQFTAAEDVSILKAAHEVGIALQLVNIARDVWTDARIGRVYVPRLWLEDEDSADGERSSPEEWVRLAREGDAVTFVKVVRPAVRRLLRLAKDKYVMGKGKIEALPKEGRRGVRCAVESYMEIGRTLERRWGFEGDHLEGHRLEEENIAALREVAVGRRTVDYKRRLWVAFRALAEG